MEATNNEVQTDNTVSPDVQDPNKDQPKQFDDMSQDDLIKMVASLQNRLHNVNEESKGRKIKLRELEADKTTRENALLEEQGEFKKLYETANAELEELRPLKTYKEEQDKLQQSKLGDLEKQLTTIEREELEIFSDDLTTDKKIRWIELKLKGRTSVNLDTSSSMQSGGSLKKLPQNRRDMGSLNSEDLMRFKEKYPDQYRVALMKN